MSREAAQPKGTPDTNITFRPSRLVKYDRDTILAEMKRVVEQLALDRAPTHKEFNRLSRVHSATVVKEFGSWDKAMWAAGFEYTRTRIKPADLVADLERICQAAGGGYFTQEFYVTNGGRYSAKTLKARLRHPDWQQLLENVLGVHRVRRVILKRTRPIPPGRAELLRELERVWKELERRPTYDEFKSRSRIGIKTFERVFGSWTRAVTALASCDAAVASWGRGMRCSRDLLLSELRAVGARATGATFSHADYRALGGSYSIGTFQKHFGAWKNAVSAIGLKDGHSRPRPESRTYSEEEFFGELQRVWEILGRQPKAREMKKHGSKMSSQAFQVRFGSWTRAIHSFCENRNAPEPSAVEVTAATGVTPSTSPRTLQLRGAIGHPKPEARAGRVAVEIEKHTPRQPSLRLRFKVLQRDRFSCQACGRSPANEPGVLLHVDHKVPYAGQGETVLENLQTLCAQCNLGKSDLTSR